MRVVFDFRFPKGLSPKCGSKIREAASHTVRSIPKQALKKLNQKQFYSLSVSVVTDSEMKKLNKQYRGKDKTTDVLSFSQLEGEQFSSARPEIGDVIISLPTAKRQAKEYVTALEEELARLTVHGVLHLFGYDHERSKKDEVKMFRLQEKILSTL